MMTHFPPIKDQFSGSSFQFSTSSRLHDIPVLTTCRSTPALRTRFGLSPVDVRPVSLVLPRPMTVLKLRVATARSSVPHWWEIVCPLSKTGRDPLHHPACTEISSESVCSCSIVDHGPSSWVGVSLQSLLHAVDLSLGSSTHGSLALAAAERARGVPLYSTGSRSSVTDAQRDVWSSQALRPSHCAVIISILRNPILRLHVQLQMERWSALACWCARVVFSSSDHVSFVHMVVCPVLFFAFDAAVGSQHGSQGCVQPAKNSVSDREDTIVLSVRRCLTPVFPQGIPSSLLQVVLPPTSPRVYMSSLPQFLPLPRCPARSSICKRVTILHPGIVFTMESILKQGLCVSFIGHVFRELLRHCE